MLYDSMLQKYLRGPVAVNARELVLTLDAIVADAENLAERAPPLQAGEPGGLVQVRSGRGGGFELVGEVRMLGGESDNVRLSLPQGLLDQLVAGALIEPRVHPAGEGGVPFGGNYGDWTILGRFGVVVLHFDFTRGKLGLNPGGLIAAGASEILLRVGQ
jgi:hypothetical protein